MERVLSQLVNMKTVENSRCCCKIAANQIGEGVIVSVKIWVKTSYQRGTFLVSGREVHAVKGVNIGVAPGEIIASGVNQVSRRQFPE